MKFQWGLPALVVAGVLGLVAIALSIFQVTITFETDKKERSTLPVADKVDSPTASAPIALSEAPTVSTPSPVVESKSIYKTSRGGIQVAALRMSNQTDQPVRIALLARRAGTSGVPAHWDFAPKEGSEKGLLLSLPEGKLKLEKGDIVVAFAQDGSRRYWGPYVLGETPAPVWNAQVTEWELVLK